MTDENSPQEPQPSFRESFAEAMRQTGIGQVAPGEVPTAASLLKAIGGVRGLVESILPGLGFLIVYTISKNLVLSIAVPLALAIVFVIVRLATKSVATQALAGIALLAVSAVLALVTGRAENNFLPGLVINSACVLVLLVSILVRWPLIGIIVGFLTNEPTEWRHDKAKRRILYLVTWLWVGLFAARLVIEVPLYLAHETALLAGARLITGVPLYAIVLWVTWLLVRAAYGRANATTAAE